MVKQKERNADDVNFFKTTPHMKYRMKPVSATILFHICMFIVSLSQWRLRLTVCVLYRSTGAGGGGVSLPL